MQAINLGSGSMHRADGKTNQGQVVKRETGITLVETLTIVVLIGILAAVAIPSLAPSSSPYDVVREARRAHSVLVEARSRATAEQRDYRFSVSAGNSYQVQYDNGAGWTAFRTISLPAGIAMTIGGGDSGAIVFKPHGRVEGPTAIALEDGRAYQRVSILASGLVRWEGPTP